MAVCSKKTGPLRLLSFGLTGLFLFLLCFLPFEKIFKDSRSVLSATSTRLNIPIANNLPVPDLTANSVYLIDLDSGLVLYEKNPDSRFYPASTTKIMTALVARRIYQEDQILSVPADAALGQTVDLSPGDKLTARDLIYALMINSGNDAALTLAYNSPGGYPDFIKRMNSLAQELGATNTHFTNSSGLIDPSHYTTSRDLSLFAKEAIGDLLIRDASSRKTYQIKDVTDTKTYHLETTNKILGEKGIVGLKTGWTPESGECLVSFVERDGHKLLVTILSSKDRFGETLRLLDWAFANHVWEKI